MLELNGELYYKVFECGKIPRYMDPDNRYNEDYIYQVAKNYDPVNVHEAPFWLGHPFHGDDSRAGGWIKSVLSVGKELYVSFSQIMPWMKDLYDSGEFKKCSVEMGDLMINSEGKSIPYLWALGATNIPAVKGLPVMKFSEDSISHKMMNAEALMNKVCFSFMNFDYPTEGSVSYDNKTILQNQNDIFMNDTLKKLADTVGLKYSEDISDADLASAINEKTAEIKAAELNAVKELNSFKEAKAVKLVDDAIKAGQLQPSQNEEFESFAKTNFEQCEKVISALPKTDLTDKKINSGGSQSFKTPETKSTVTYEDVLNSPDKFIGVLSEEEILKLKDNSPRFKAIPILD